MSLVSHTSLKELLKSDKLHISMEFYAFMALRYWAEHTNAKECEIREVLPFIRFAQIGTFIIIYFILFYLFLMFEIDVDRLRNLVRPSKLGVMCPDLYKHYMDALVRFFLCIIFLFIFLCFFLTSKIEVIYVHYRNITLLLLICSQC
jgi:hypothetical protein